MIATQSAFPAPHLLGHSVLYNDLPATSRRAANMPFLVSRTSIPLSPSPSLSVSSLGKNPAPIRRAPPPPPKRRNAICYPTEENPFADPQSAASTSTTTIPAPAVVSSSLTTPPSPPPAAPVVSAAAAPTHYTRPRRTSIGRGNSSPFASSTPPPRRAPVLSIITSTSTTSSSGSAPTYASTLCYAPVPAPIQAPPRPNPLIQREQRNTRARAVACIMLNRTNNRGRTCRTRQPGETGIYVRSKLGKSVVSWDDIKEEEEEEDVCMVENVQDWPEDVEGVA
ncbi:uncharacterized protein STEHIDRAFT_124446 [Stereum hirsutum FP-91666 SS1]|uniref:uncharacterized protein n=1 Tax=Stereum hirsutum (strain FP-91666) TaxID=721885 RepID=UPI000444A117|nr:uncharacterized protein STEHIDRAFT_124446 [Stereum hirsutum FP-91666 SS1]EIM82263.1 hypothetical protein STEHIDRAFT_124446 [Stereum hirsutum FP-91666 SS1]